MSLGYNPPYPQEYKKPDNTLLIVLVVIILVVLVAGALVFAAVFFSPTVLRTSTPGNSQQVSVTATNYQIDYTSGGSYFGPSSQSTNARYDTTTDSEFTDTITLSSSAIFTTHTINSITISTPGFTLISTAPSLPYNVGAGGSVSITLTIRTPSVSYYGPLGVLISTS